ncbi:tudor domain-containing protein 7 [Osmia bicornis bicornis]|uniref:tudor domain-containing protein 7 n=1 Tax=Osmia bicornis bicornis TaxID=1437191 RepID=UPI001EAF7B0E|nr:tudor domain-containing protein 7 [Osmia bicornis bicornis]XP_029040469.2 tudor domain-containing protein 7 [Osmia bicornis bicornis]XP_029040470.2 tudor domain-containing protein 7 [Osmia bicornis bicornis]XP_029040471.2 tudor domain-containing protein 7 [Osmia bicornis bicornis]XP_029040473.2 tudor domain-containing protein 7 [Osmia bicornis bicornis]
MEKQEVIKNLRACLISAKGGVKIENLNRDYKMLIDEQIPFRKFGYPSLVAFLYTVPGIKIVDKGADVYVEAVPTEESAHITRLISRQKTVSKRHRRVVNAWKPSSFRLPMVTRKAVRTVQSTNQNLYSQISGRQNTSVPAMPTKITIYRNDEKPRYIQSNCGISPNSPSKSLKDRQMNSVLTTNQSVINTQRDTVCLKNDIKLVPPLMSQTPKTVNNNTETFKKSSNISERLKINPNIPSLLSLNTSIPTSPLQSGVLSPLSPGQILADGKMSQSQQSPINSFTLLDNAKKIVPKSQPLDPRDELRERAVALNLPRPVYQIYPTPIKNSKNPSVFARVKIGPHGYSSYPEEARTEDEAQKIAARFALLDLVEKFGPVFTLNETKDKKIIKERVLSIVDDHPNGIFMHKVPIYYKQKYEEILPENWEKTVEECPAIVLEKGVDNSIILRRFVLSPEKIKNITSSKTDKVQLHPIGPAVPGQLQLPEENLWIVSVTCVISTTEIWARIIGDAYSEQFGLMTAEMAKHYSNIQQHVKPLTIVVGNYYVVFEGDSWHRVRCVDYNSVDGIVTVSFIDHGDEDIFHQSKLHMLDKKFCGIPAQALRLCLAGLEDFGDCDSVVDYIEKFLILDRALYAEVLNRGKGQDEQFATVIFYDTQGPDDVNLNAEFSEHIFQHIVVAPKLTEDQVFEVFNSHIEQNGDVYVQLECESMKLLVSLLNRLICTRLNAEHLENCTVTTVDPSKTYFVSVNNNWYRGKIVGNSLYSQLKVFLIDFGKTITTTKSNLLSLERLSEVLTKYPAQALKVHLHNIDKSMVNEKMIAKLIELAPKGEPLLVKVISVENNIPVVELFRRIQPSNMLVSINNTLALEELAKAHGDGNNNIRPRKRIERMNSKHSTNEDDDVLKSLKPPKISGIGEYFDIHVTMAAHPGNFTIQPFEDKSALEAMMIQLQEICRDYKGPIPTTESVREGKLYAAKHIDGHWYRVCISSVIKQDMVSVYFCDFGDVSVLPLSKLQPLKSQFLELPYQAIKARLSGIRPIDVDWSVEDSLRFQELVVEKNFVSVVVESKPDVLSPADTVLGLKLIDVNTTEDIYIDQLLVREGRAVFVD